MSKMSIQQKSNQFLHVFFSFAFQPDFLSQRCGLIPPKKLLRSPPKMEEKKFRSAQHPNWVKTQSPIPHLRQKLSGSVCLFGGRNSLANSRYTLQGIDISPQKWHFEDDFLFFPKVGYVSSLEGIFYLPTQSKHFLKWGWKNRIWGWDYFHQKPRSLTVPPRKNWPKPKRQPDCLPLPSFFRGCVGGNQRVFGFKFQELETYLSKRQPFNPKGVLWKAASKRMRSSLTVFFQDFFHLMSGNWWCMYCYIYKCAYFVHVYMYIYTDIICIYMHIYNIYLHVYIVWIQAIRNNAVELGPLQKWNRSIRSMTLWQPKFHRLSSIFTSKIMHCGERIDCDRHSLKGGE